MGRVIHPAEVEIFLRKFSIVPFADVTGVVAVRAEDAGIGIAPWFSEFFEIGCAVT